MPSKRLFDYFLLIVLIISLAGCVYLRLLEVKHQLADFEHHCSLEDRDDLGVNFRSPVLLKEDILFLAKRGPTFAEDGPKQGTWEYHFIKQYLPHQEEARGTYDLPVRLFFRENKMNRGTLPERFCRLMPRAFLIEVFRAIGRVHVNPANRHAQGEFYENQEKWGTPLPKKQDFLRLLGEPYSEENTETTSTLTFRYLLQRGGHDQSPRPDAWARLTFLKAGENPIRMEAKFAGLRLTLTFQRGGS
jgi:hypothetical protein